MKRIVLIILSFVSMVHLFAQSLLINEIQVANIDQFIDPSYNYDGWIELYNPRNQQYLDSPVVTRSFSKYSSIYSLPILSALRGQQISNVPSGQIVIQQTIYHDGSSKTRKVRMISK